MSDTDLSYLSATEMARRFRDRSLSPVDVMTATIARAETVEPAINAFTYTYYDDAMAAARSAEERYASGEPSGPLDGIPVGIKDESYIAGLPTSNASRTMENYVPTITSPINQRILDAGGIVHARTATPEFSCAGYCWSDLWGVTRNPWNAAFTPGGSSGGSAASLAAGSSALATGSDIGGSIRIPAGCSGVVGYKPPYGRNPQEPPFNLDTYCHSGPLARTVADTILLQNIMAGPHEIDIASLRPKLELPTSFKSIKGMKIAVSMDLGFFPVDSDVEKNTNAAIETLQSLGAEIEWVDLGWTEDVMAAGLHHLEHIFGGWIASQGESRPLDQLTTYARAFAERSRGSSAGTYIETLVAAGKMYETLGPVLERCQVLICPTNAVPAVPADFDQSTDTIEISGQPVDPLLGWPMTLPFNIMSRCPVLSVPTGHASNGVPTGMQIVGRTLCDADVFQVGLAYETAVGNWYDDPAKRPACHPV